VGAANQPGRGGRPTRAGETTSPRSDARSDRDRGAQHLGVLALQSELAALPDMSEMKLRPRDHRDHCTNTTRVFFRQRLVTVMGRSFCCVHRSRAALRTLTRIGRVADHVPRIMIMRARSCGEFFTGLDLAKIAVSDRKIILMRSRPCRRALSLDSPVLGKAFYRAMTDEYMYYLNRGMDRKGGSGERERFAFEPLAGLVYLWDPRVPGITSCFQTQVAELNPAYPTPVNRPETETRCLTPTVVRVRS
jgi:hypothetical protein